MREKGLQSATMFGVCVCVCVKVRWCLHCFLIAKLAGLALLPGAKLPGATSGSTHTPSHLWHIKEGGSLVVVSPARAPAQG